MAITISDKYKCCGCGACENICPKNAIKMQPDERGFLFPIVDTSICVECGLCERVCSFSNEEDLLNDCVTAVYAVKNKDTERLLKSASGGAFSVLAKYVLDRNGHVYGVAWNGNMEPVHIGISTIEDLERLQGSKYVQSNMGDIYYDVQRDLEKGCLVLFSGTPCQCAGIRSFLRRDYSNLICVELICHGVPNAVFFREYLDLIEKKIHGKIVDVKFRDKARGWGGLLHFIYQDKRGKTKHKYLSIGESYYYYYYYWGCNLYRDSCYKCKYASKKRCSDFTIGDYWGIQRAHPELEYENGISVLLANTSKAQNMIHELDAYCDIIPSTLEMAQKENGQLISPTKKPEVAEQIWEQYYQGGAEMLDAVYRKVHYKEYAIGKAKRMVPLVLKKMVRKRLKC